MRWSEEKSEKKKPQAALGNTKQKVRKKEKSWTRNRKDRKKTRVVCMTSVKVTMTPILSKPVDMIHALLWDKNHLN